MCRSMVVAYSRTAVEQVLVRNVAYFFNATFIINFQRCFCYCKSQKSVSCRQSSSTGLGSLVRSEWVLYMNALPPAGASLTIEPITLTRREKPSSRALREIPVAWQLVTRAIRGTDTQIFGRQRTTEDKLCISGEGPCAFSGSTNKQRTDKNKLYPLSIFTFQ